MTALQLLEKAQSGGQSAKPERYCASAAKHCKTKFLDEFEEQITKNEDRLEDLKNFSLITDINSGKQGLSIDECKNRMLEIAELELVLALQIAELEYRRKIFNNYFPS